MFYDMPLEELRTYLPDREDPPDFDLFWDQTISDARGRALEASFVPVDYGLRAIDTFDVTFSGFNGHRIKGWLLLPKESKEPLPCVIEYIGYGSGRGFPTDWLTWSCAGFAHFVMDSRGQGAGWFQGDTPDPDPQGGYPQYPGFLTRGILSPETYYYRRLYTDGVRAVDAASSHPAIDHERIAVTGESQGGGIAIAVSGLEPRVLVCMPDAPFLCHFRRATEITDSAPYNEIVKYCKTHRDKVDVVFNTLQYFDGMNLSARSEARAFYSVGLMDFVCPPSTVFAAYNHHAGLKDIRVYHYNDHEAGGNYQVVEKVRFLHSIWGG